jgi:hypothetical protein
MSHSRPGRPAVADSVRPAMRPNLVAAAHRDRCRRTAA